MSFLGDNEVAEAIARTLLFFGIVLVYALIFFIAIAGSPELQNCDCDGCSAPSGQEAVSK